MLTLAPNGDVLIGGSDGKVAFSTDGGSSFTATEKMVEDVSGAVIVVADPDYENNNIIYASNAGGTTKTVYRASATKTTTFSGRGPTLGTGHIIRGMVEANGLIYVLSSDGSASKLWRNMLSETTLATADTAALALWSGRSTSSGLTATPAALKVSDGPKFWAVTTTDLLSITDPIAVVGPQLNVPASAATIPVNPQTGRAYTITFSFDRYHNKYVTGLQLQIATDSAFTGVVTDLTNIAVDKDQISVTVGPNATYAAEYMPGYTYYWRVRTSETSPMYSPWSEVRSFTVESLGILPTAIQAPAPGAANVPVMPTFSWSATEGAIAYEFAIDPGWQLAGVDNALKTNTYVTDHPLEYDTSYTWKVRAVFNFKPADYGEWVSGVFTTMAEPAPVAKPYTCPQDGLTFATEAELAEHWAKFHGAPAPPAPAPPAVPDWALVTIIIIGAVLFIAVIVLIVRTRRVV